MDDLELASRQEDNYTSTLIKLHARRATSTPEYNEQGHKVCSECGELIPALRAAIAWVSTCVPCQQQKERT